MLHFRCCQREQPAMLVGTELFRIRKDCRQSLLVLSPVLRQGFLKQPLIRGLQARGFAQRLVGCGNLWVKVQNLSQQEFCTRPQLELDLLICDPEAFHSSRSIVACKLYFCSW